MRDHSTGQRGRWGGRTLRRIAGVGGGVLVMSGMFTAGATLPAAATTTPTSVGFTAPTAADHPYRHGAVPRVLRVPTGTPVPSPVPYPTTPGTAAGALQPAAGPRTASSKDLTYGGGFTGGGLVNAGVTTGQPKVYLVFYGSQWGTESTDSAGDAVFSGDPDAEASALQTFYKGLGTDGELWSGVVTQYCDGVAVGSVSCNTQSQNIPYPSPGVLAGVWYDNSAGATATSAAGATGSQLAAEAEAAAAHFGNTTQASNRDTQYVIASPTGTDPDGWTDKSTGYCAYHDDTHDPFIDGAGPVGGPIIAFTNLPYVPDAGVACGANMVNPGPNGVLDGATSTASHEYAETLTDQFPESVPPGGWSNGAGSEIADLCVYLSPPSAGASYNLTLATGTVVVQGLWSNAVGGCVQNSTPSTFPPVITSFSPKVAPAGAQVTISGNDLNGATAVTFNGVPAAIVFDSVGALVAVVPSGATTGPIRVTTVAGSATARKTFQPAPTVSGFSPGSGVPGSLVTITGSGLANATKVSLGGKRMPIVSDGPTQIVAVVPKRRIGGTISVKTKGGIGTSAASFAIT